MSTTPVEPASTSADPPRTASPPEPTALQLNATLNEQWRNCLAQLVKTSKISRSRGSALAEKPEVQALLDKDLFMIQSDRRTKMNPIQQLQLLKVLAQFFLERVDDGHRYSYFEAIFLGRADDPFLHEYRISVLFQLVSFSAQYPCTQMFNHMMTWLCQLKNDDLERQYSDRLMEMIYEGFIRTSTEKKPMHAYLGPLELTCSEFSALFVARAPLHGPMKPPMASLIVRYCTKNMNFLLRHLRDTPWLGNDFAEKVMPKIVEQTLEGGNNDLMDQVASCISFVLMRWHLDVVASGERRGPNKKIEVIDLLLSPTHFWTKRRVCLLITAMASSSRSEFSIQKMIRETEPPIQFRPALDLLCQGGVKENPTKFLEAIAEMNLEAEDF